MKKQHLIIILFLALAMKGFAQQEAQYSQYMFNGLILNPAYAGSRELLSGTMLLRKQWVGMDGAPSTGTLSIHGPSRNRRSGFGLTLWNDQIGVTRRTGGTAGRMCTSRNPL